MKKIALVVFIAAGFLANTLFGVSATSSVATASEMYTTKMQQAMADAGI